MAIEKMKLVQVCGLKDGLDDFITSCCIGGDFHPENAIGHLSDSLGFVSLNEENPYTTSIQKIEEIASIANVTLKETFTGNEIIIDREELVFVDDLKEKLSVMLSSRNEIAEELKKITDSTQKLSHYKSLNVSVDDILSTEFLKVRFGRIPIDCYPKLNAYENNKNVMYIDCSQDEKNHWGLYVAPISKAEEIDRIFASLYFEKIEIPKSEGTPAQVLEELEKCKRELEAQLAEIDSNISGFWSENSEHIESLYAHLKIVSAAFDLRRYAATDESGTYFIYVGWVPYSGLKWFKKQIKQLDDISYEEFEADEETHSKPPVKLKNRKPFRPFEMFVEMYGLPSYDGFDITPFVAITYSLLFGIMFADLGQGFVVALGGYILYKLKGVKLAGLMVPCGVCSMIFGTLVGSVFGYEELLDPLYEKLKLKGKPLDVMGSIKTVLLIAIGIGIALVVVSMLLSVYKNIRNKKFGEAIFSQNGLTGIILYGVLVAAVVGFMSKKSVLPGAVIAVVAVVCLLILYFKEIIVGKIDKHDEYMPESWADFLMQNFFEVIEYILTYFSNTVSFLRVGAFMLVHAGMMMVFSSLSDNPYSAGGIIAMIFGNIIVIALEGLLTGIQVLRLEFYEMFSRFYEGDGEPFQSVGMRKNRGFL
ncbi:MAG: hypothetical protein KBT46_04565, partial [Ruminococcus sp.]|nr:hypothetical protein [Candidatus Copronaster equi]